LSSNLREFNLPSTWNGVVKGRCIPSSNISSF
jgi:hypothetical protein